MSRLLHYTIRSLHSIRRIVQTRPGLFLMLILTLIAGGACQEPFTLAELVDGPDGKSLSLSPSTAVLVINNSLTLTPSGGIPPYSYTIISGGGTIVGSLFTAPPAPGTVRVRVKDSVGNSSDAVYTINGGGLGLGITPSSQTVSTGGSISFAAIGGTGPFEFTIPTNNSGGSVNLTSGAYTAGSNSGGGSVNDTIRITDTADSSFANATVTVQAKPLSISPSSITVYVNQSIEFSAVGGDGPFSFALTTDNSGASIVGNTYTAGSTSGVSDIVTMTDNYDGRTRTATISVIDAVTGLVDYAPGTVGGIVPDDLLAGSSFDAQFDIDHQLPGGAGGSKTIAWTLFASTDTVIGGTDDRITATGSTGPLSAGGTTTVTVSGATWPSEPGNYYLLVEIAAEDDLTFSNNRNQSAGTTQIYAPLSITPTVAAVYTGQQIDFIVSGGTGSYSYSFAQSGSGLPSMSGDQYTAGASGGTDIIEVQDDTYPAWPSANATVEVLEGLRITPQVVSVPTSNILTFFASGGTPPYTFSMESGNGVVTSGGDYTAPTSTGTDLVKVSDDAGRFQIATVTVTSQQPLSITPSSLILLAGSNFDFSASGGVAPYTFTKVSGGGSVAGGGVYTAAGTPGIAVVRVTDSDSPVKTADAVITIVNIGPLSIAPTTVTVEQGTSFTFSTSGGTPQYAYSVVSGAGFINNSTGEYTASSTLGVETIRVSDAASAISEAIVNVAPAAPTNLIVDGTWGGPQDIRLTWNDNASGEDGFRIERKISGGIYAEIATVGSNITTFDDAGLSPNIPYSYRVRAYKDPNPNFSGYSNDDFDIPNS